MIGGFGVVIDLDSYRMGAFRDERATLVIALQKARSSALNNMYLSPHGVAIFPAAHPQHYVVFQGTSYVSADHAMDEILESKYPATLAAGSPAEIVFSQLSAEAFCDGAACTDSDPLVLQDLSRGAAFDVLVNEEGRVSW
jgi:hypothetical protein